MKQASELLKFGTVLLSKKHLDNPVRDAELLLMKALHAGKTGLYAGLSNNVTAPSERKYLAYLKRRTAFEPVSYILGEKEFYDCTFKVNSSVLIPRPETEFLVQAAIDTGRKYYRPSILDIGTGSGCVAVTIAKHLQYAKVVSVDLSTAALSLAKKNAVLNGTSNLTFVKSDLFASLKKELKFDIIVSNPPYVSAKEMKALLPETKKYEPSVALCGGKDGLDYYRRIVSQVKWRLNYGGFLIFEVGYKQAKRVRRLLEISGLTITEVIKDYGGIKRVVVGCWK
ncbi:MAG: peptide chain release factor N(5)-glutamine methyltransferase [Candidatus Firestonebacteria bacterium]